MHGPYEENFVASKKNKANHQINFKLLECAKPVAEIPEGLLREFLVKEKDLLDATHDEAVAHLNEACATGYLLPLNQMNILLMKFYSKRFGEDDEVERLYHFICYYLHDKFSEDVINTHAYFIQVLINRNKLELSTNVVPGLRLIITKKVEEIFNKMPEEKIFEALLDLHQIMGNDEGIRILLRTYPHFQSGHAVHICSLSRKEGAEAAFNYYRRLMYERKLSGSQAHVAILIIFNSDLLRSKAIFTMALTYNWKLANDTDLIKSMLRILLQHDLDEGRFFYKELRKRLQVPNSIYLMMINNLYKHNKLNEAYNVFKAACSDGFFVKNIFQICKKLPFQVTELKLELHSDFITSTGAPAESTTVRDGVKYCLLKDMFAKLADDNDKLTRVLIITGQGTGSTKKVVLEMLKKHFFDVCEEKIEEQAGSLIITVNNRYYERQDQTATANIKQHKNYSTPKYESLFFSADYAKTHWQEVNERQQQFEIEESEKAWSEKKSCK